MSNNNAKVIPIEQEEFYRSVVAEYDLEYTPSHVAYLKTIEKHVLTLCSGPAGTGKTLFAAKAALDMLKRGEVSRIVLSRPAIEAEKGMGHLPGDLNEKFSPYFEPFEDLLYELEHPSVIRKFIESGQIIAKPLGFLRGKTFHDAFVILDEGQNATSKQYKLFLTRVGRASKAVVTGDIKQMDINCSQSGLKDAIDRLHDLNEVGIHKFTVEDVKRSDFVRKIIERYEEYELPEK